MVTNAPPLVDPHLTWGHIRFPFGFPAFDFLLFLLILWGFFLYRTGNFVTE